MNRLWEAVRESLRKSVRGSVLRKFVAERIDRWRKWPIFGPHNWRIMISFLLLAVLVLLYIGWEVYVAVHPRGGDTLSNVAAVLLLGWPPACFILGCLVTHFAVPLDRLLFELGWAESTAAAPSPVIGSPAFGFLVCVAGLVISVLGTYCLRGPTEIFPSLWNLSNLSAGALFGLLFFPQRYTHLWAYARDYWGWTFPG